MRAATRNQTNNAHQQEGPTPNHFCQQVNIFSFKNPGEPMKLRVGLNEMM